MSYGSANQRDNEIAASGFNSGRGINDFGGMNQGRSVKGKEPDSPRSRAVSSPQQQKQLGGGWKTFDAVPPVPKGGERNARTWIPGPASILGADEGKVGGNDTVERRNTAVKELFGGRRV
ncbi:hypothetical protein HK097_010311 [Rhizophlyctis rosea]|uniref:Uncharacterized protein n=1 Tax=Rhizophlyctis rosea TaxID=64517 RepID=A0AAD5X3X8_9FUNG|nr:hypothetical protein HK097_010311 [Rhizophlyctis rosea]